MTRAEKNIVAELRDIILDAIRAGDWKVDGACDPESALRRVEGIIGAPDYAPALWPHPLSDALNRLQIA